MNAKAVRLHGKNDLRLDSYELPALPEDGIRAKIISDTVCMSTYKVCIQGEGHKRVPEGISASPVVVGHEFCGVIEEVGGKWKDSFAPGERFVLQPARPGKFAAPGYSFEFCGGDATKILIPDELISDGCVMKYDGDAYFRGSLAEPISCLVAALRAEWHTSPDGRSHMSGLKPSGNAAILGGAGAMGIGMVKLILASEIRPKTLVVTDINSERLSRAARILPQSEAEKRGVKLVYFNPANFSDPLSTMKRFAGGDFDDIFVFSPSEKLISDAQLLLGYDGCLNFFAGPADRGFSAKLNFYDVHYSSLHVVGTSGGDSLDMADALRLISSGKVDPAPMITHICGLDALMSVIPKLPALGAGKILCYPGISLGLTAIPDFEKLGRSNPMMKLLSELTKPSGVWNRAAEELLLERAGRI